MSRVVAALRSGVAPARRAVFTRPAGPGATLLQLQRSAGNRAVDDLIAGLARPTIQRTIGDGHDLTAPRFIEPARDPDLEACFDDEARLTMGGKGQPGARKVESGDGVRKVQESLVDLGLLDSSAVTGTYTRATWDAVKALKKQEHLGWESMGDVGPGTMAFLNRRFTAAPPPTCPPCPEDPRTPGCAPCTPVPAPTTCDPLKGAERSGAGDNPHLGAESEGMLRFLIATDCLLPFPTGMCEDGVEAQNVFDEAFKKADSLLEAPPMDMCGPPVPSGSHWPGSAKLPGKVEGPDDAFRHCFASCVLASRTSKVWAERVGTDHENSQDPSSLSGRMDLHNNATGRGFSKLRDESGCEASCLDALRGGQLITVRVRAPQCDDKVCLGASDQTWP